MTSTFRVLCCDRRRGVLPSGVLLCTRCDYDHDAATVIPREHAVRDLPRRVVVWHPLWGTP